MYIYFYHSICLSSGASTANLALRPTAVTNMQTQATEKKTCPTVVEVMYVITHYLSLFVSTAAAEIKMYR